MSKPHLVKPAPVSQPKPRGRAGVIVAVMLVVAAALVFWVWKSQRNRSEATDVDATTATPVTTGNAAADPTAQSAAQFEKLIANWLRPDGGYILQFKSVDADGKIDAGYFNPRPINVAKAVASMDGGALKVVVELRDVNYPGSTYTLTYDASTDQLRGNYFQAVEQSNYEVFFQRWKPGAGN